jgi:hypothetical protein
MREDFHQISAGQRELSVAKSSRCAGMLELRSVFELANDTEDAFVLSKNIGLEITAVYYFKFSSH